MTTEKRAPALQTTIQPLVDSKSNPEKGTAGPNGESAKPVSPQAGEEAAESLESVAGDTDGASERDDAEGKTTAPVEEYEIFLDGKEEEESKPTPQESAAMYRMRKAEAEAARLKRELEAVRAPAGTPPDPGDEPTSEDCAFDEAELKRRLRKWDQEKAAFDAHKAKAVDQEKAQAQEIENRHASYLADGAELAKRMPGYVEAEKLVAESMDVSRKVTLLKYADKPASVVYYLGRNPEKLEEFAKETDLGRFVAKLAKLEVSMKERKKNTTQAPPPEQSPRGSGAVNAGDTTLEKLRRKATETGDYGPVNDYKRKLKAQRGQRK